MVRFRDSEERERYMDSLERQMEHQREQIEHTLDEIEGSGRRTALEKLRSSFPDSHAAPPCGTGRGKARRSQTGRTAKLSGAGGSSGGKPQPGLLSTARRWFY